MLGHIVVTMLGLAAAAVAADTSPTPKLSVLIVDGMNNHDWPRATKILKETLTNCDRFEVDVSTSPSSDAPARDWEQWRPQFAEYDVVVINFNGGHKATSLHWPDNVEKDLEAYVGGGGGLVIYHSANNSFPNWPAYNQMIGLGWRNKDFGPGLIVSRDETVVAIPQGEGRNPGHGPEHDFQITMWNTDHAITKGLPKKWMHPHEQLTHGQHGPAKNMTILSYAYSKDTGDNEVMDWVIPYGQGRVYVTMLGHLWKDKPDTAMQCIGFQTMLIRGCEWAATAQVSYPVPEDFPTATQRVLRAQAALKKPEDQVLEIIDQDGTVFSVYSPSGIGSATISRDSWPERVRLRCYLRGLEGLTISNGSVTLKASVLSHSPYRRLMSVVAFGQEQVVKKDSPYWTEIRACDAQADAISGLPADGGYFEMLLPQALLAGKPNSLTIDWIDFYRQ